MVQAMPLGMKDENHAEVGAYLQSLAGMLLNNRGYGESWRLQYLTDLKVLPDYEQGWGWEYGGRQRPARRSTPTAIRSSITCPRVSRRPRPTASAGGGVSSRPSK